MLDLRPCVLLLCLCRATLQVSNLSGRMYLKCILPHRTSGCGEMLNHVSTHCSLFYTASTPDHRGLQSCIVEDAEADLSM
jgi:hypothetical protein